MQASPAAREFRAIVPIEGYVHKFRLEACEEAAAQFPPPEVTVPTVNLGPLLGKFVLFALTLIGIGAVGVLRVLV